MPCHSRRRLAGLVPPLEVPLELRPAVVATASAVLIQSIGGRLDSDKKVWCLSPTGPASSTGHVRIFNKYWDTVSPRTTLLA